MRKKDKYKRMKPEQHGPISRMTDIVDTVNSSRRHLKAGGKVSPLNGVTKSSFEDISHVSFWQAEFRPHLLRDPASEAIEAPLCLPWAPCRV